jgi:type IV secretory pathway VirB2 component (pilin)
MQPHKKFAFDIGITFLVTVVLGKDHITDDLGLYRMITLLYGIVILFMMADIFVTIQRRPN